MGKVLITDTILRDAHQSQAATRMRLEEMLPVADKLDKIGYYSLECWGGATFDSCMRFLNEDPWERLRALRKAMPNTKLQMLFRGQNILGYKHYADDVVDEFVKKSIENGIDIIRIFDALNDLRNLEQAVKSTKKYGGNCEIAISYTISPVHTEEYFLKLAKEIEALGVQSICVKDMAGIMSPKEAYDLVTALKKEIKVPIVIHTHNTTGLGPMTLMKAVEAGADVIDTAVSCFSGGTSQPPTETLVYALREMGYEISVKDDVVKKINDFFKPIRAKYLANGLLNPVVMGNATDALIYQVPGGMLSNLVAQLTAQKALDKLDAVLLEVPKVRKDLGYPPLVTPMSQMVGVQATVNVLTGGRYKNVSKEIKAYVKGEYGRAPGKIDPEVQKLVLGDEKPITQRYADLLEPGFEKAKRELGERAHSDEDVLSYIAFPAQAEAYFEKRDRKEDDNEIHFSIREVK
mgnify:FL=1